MASAKLFQKVPDGRKLDVLIYLFTQVAAVTTDPETLMANAKAFQKIPEGAKMNVLLWIACNITGGSGGSGATIFTAAAGVAPVAAPTSTGQIAVNKSTNDVWVSPDGATWQLVIGP